MNKLATQFTYTLQFEGNGQTVDNQSVSFLLSKDFTGSYSIEQYDYTTAATLNTQGLNLLIQDVLSTYETTNHLDNTKTVITNYRIYTLEDNLQIYFDDNGYKSSTTNTSALIKVYTTSNGQAPNPVTTLTGTPDISSIVWSWNEINHFENGYEIVNESNQVIAIVSKDSNQWIELDLIPGIQYKRGIRSFNQYGKSSITYGQAITISNIYQTAPAQPANFKGITINTTSIRWTWSAAQNADYYSVRDKNNNEIAKTNDLSYIETNLTPDTLYERKVIAVNNIGESVSLDTSVAFTDAVIEISALSTPTQFRATVINETAALWEWNATPENDTVKYRVYDSNGEILFETGVGITEFFEENLIPNTHYLHSVQAFADNGISLKSNNAEITMPNAPEQLQLTIEPDAWNLDNIVYPIIQPLIQERLSAFQSGIGNGLDLKLNMNPNAVSKEKFNYSYQVKGIYEEQLNVYEKMYFKYRFNVTGFINANSYSLTTDWEYGSINGKKPYSSDNNGEQRKSINLILAIPDNVIVDKITLEVDNADIKYTFSNGIQDGNSYYTKTNGDSVEFYTEKTTRLLIEKAFYGPIIYNEQVFLLEDKQELIITQNVLSPAKDPSLNSKSVARWQLVVIPNNTNVSVQVLDIIPNPLPQDNIIPIRLKAKIINLTQSPWNPLVHSGFYYFNQDEFYLYSENNVQGKILVDEKAQIFEFPFVLHVDIQKQLAGAQQKFYYTDRNDWMGILSHVDIISQPGNLIIDKLLGEYNDSGYFESNTTILL